MAPETPRVKRGYQDNALSSPRLPQHITEYLDIAKQHLHDRSTIVSNCLNICNKTSNGHGISTYSNLQSEIENYMRAERGSLKYLI